MNQLIKVFNFCSHHCNNLKYHSIIQRTISAILFFNRLFILTTDNNVCGDLCYMNILTLTSARQNVWAINFCDHICCLLDQMVKNLLVYVSRAFRRVSLISYNIVTTLIFISAVLYKISSNVVYCIVQLSCQHFLQAIIGLLLFADLKHSTMLFMHKKIFLSLKSKNIFLDQGSLF